MAAFQEEGWPAHLDDPLPPLHKGCSKDRLRDAIRHLNANQKNRLIRFRGDGTGQGILWELVDGPAPTVAAAGVSGARTGSPALLVKSDGVFAGIGGLFGGAPASPYPG